MSDQPLSDSNEETIPRRENEMPNTSGARRCRMERAFLTVNVFAGFNPIRAGFDSSAIAYFTLSDFRKVIDRCSQLGIAIIGFEVFTRDGLLVDIQISTNDFESKRNDWCKQLLNTYQMSSPLLFSATYDVPFHLVSE